MVKGIVVQFRRGRHTVKERHFLLDIGLSSREEAKKMAGKDVEWKSTSGKIIKGKVSDAHGNNGLLRAIFEKGLPGQAVTTEVELKGDLPKKEEKKTEFKEVNKVEKKIEKEKEERVEEK